MVQSYRLFLQTPHHCPTAREAGENPDSTHAETSVAKQKESLGNRETGTRRAKAERTLGGRRLRELMGLRQGCNRKSAQEVGTSF